MTVTSGSGSRDHGHDAEGDIVGAGGASRITRASNSGGAGGSRGGGARPLAAMIGSLLIGLIVGGLATSAYLDDKNDDGENDGGEKAFLSAVDQTRYQAVILSNDKVYFGQLRSISDDFFELQSAFFLRETREDATAEPVRALLPVNREIHAPDNSMLIRKAEVVLVENLAKDSPILTEIKRQKG